MGGAGLAIRKLSVRDAGVEQAAGYGIRGLHAGEAGYLIWRAGYRAGCRSQRSSGLKRGSSRSWSTPVGARFTRFEGAVSTVGLPKRAAFSSYSYGDHR